MFKALLLIALLTVSVAANAATYTLANGATTTGAQAAWAMPCPTSIGTCARTFACNETVASGSGTATVLIQGSLDPTHTFWVTLATMSTITDAVTVAATDSSKFTAYRANVSAISGTTAKVYCYGGI